MKDLSPPPLLTRIQRKEAQRIQRLTRHDGPPTAWRGWFDGSAKPNPGRCGIGALLCGPGDERIEISRAAGYGNSSEAEYRALIALLQAACAANASDLTVYGDSRVIVDDINGPFEQAAPALAALRSEAVTLLARLGHVSIRWVPRHKNQQADLLSQQASGPLPGLDRPALECAVPQPADDPCAIPNVTYQKATSISS
ncbi:MAG: ribonuclease HI family protein [Gammaproteobacteria bacterium]